MNPRQATPKSKARKKRAKTPGAKAKTDSPILFEATVHPGRNKKDSDWASDIEMDRVPDAKGRVRGLIGVKQCVKLLEKGLEVRLHGSIVPGRLDPKLIETDKAFQKWLNSELSKIKGYSNKTDRAS